MIHESMIGVYSWEMRDLEIVSSLINQVRLDVINF